MKIRETLAKPVWRHLAQSPGFERLGSEAILITDSFFDFILGQQIISPSGTDVAHWMREARSSDVDHDLDLLEEVFAVCQPSFLKDLRTARILAKGPSDALGHGDGVGASAAASVSAVYEIADWDPIARPPRKPPIPRYVSVAPWQLPDEYQNALRRAADGLPGAEVGMRVLRTAVQN